KPIAAAEQGLLPWEGEASRRVLLARGVPAEAIVQLPAVVDSTKDEAQALRLYLEEHPGETVGVVTSKYHTRRTRMVMQHELGEAASRVKYFGAPTDGYDETNWWKSE